MPERSYTYYDFTLSLCPYCLKRIDAKIVFEGEQVFMLKRCPEHGHQKVLIATEKEYYRRCRNFMKPSEMPLTFNTKTHYGCPYDCGLCPDHEQHSCLTLVEVTDRCNLTCPTCYSESSPHAGRHRSLEEIEKMFDAVVRNEGNPDIIQLSGGEPTIHPDFFAILDMAKKKPVKHLMVNTNGIRIAKDEMFARRLASYMPDFEIYLQFDSFKPEVLKRLRGQDLRDVREKAIEHLNKYNLSTTLVVTLAQGQNMDEIGAILEYAAKQRCVRGVTFQPTQVAGRYEQFNPETDRVTMTEVRREILNQFPIFTEKDLIPVPCNPDALVMGYALKVNNELLPLTRFIDPDDLLDNSRNTIVYEQDERLHAHVLSLFSTAHSPGSATDEMKQLLCCLPMIKAPNLTYDNLFRVIIMQFIDAWNFDVCAVKKSCVHIVDDHGNIIPFETMNLFYRGENKRNQLQQLRMQQVTN